MRSDVAISAKNLTKTYRIFGHPGDQIKQALTLGRVRFHREFAALQEVSFKIIPACGGKNRYDRHPRQSRKHLQEILPQLEEITLARYAGFEQPRKISGRNVDLVITSALNVYAS